MISLFISFVVASLLFVDILLKFRENIVENVKCWGFISPMFSCLIGGLSAYVHWLGWFLVVVAGIVATDTINYKHIQNTKDISFGNESEILAEFTNKINSARILQANFLVFSELICFCAVAYSFIALFNANYIILCNFIFG